MRRAAHLLAITVGLMAAGVSAIAVAGDTRLVAVIHDDTAPARSLARRLSAELLASGFAAREWSCPASAATTCAAAAEPGPRVVIAAPPDATVQARVSAKGRSAGPFELASEAADRVDAVGRFAMELVTWVEVLENPSLIGGAPIAPPSLRAAAAAETTGRPVVGRRMHLGLGGLYAYDPNFEGSGGGELSLAWDWAIGAMDQRWGLRLAAGASPLSKPISFNAIRVRRSPLTAMALATTARSPGRWTLEAHGGLGIELQRLTAEDLWRVGDKTVARESRFGPVAQAGLGILYDLGDQQDRFSVGAELRLVYSLPPQVVVVGERRFGGGSAPPTVGLAIIGRWTTR
jgi:hypothetical protein